MPNINPDWAVREQGEYKVCRLCDDDVTHKPCAAVSRKGFTWHICKPCADVIKAAIEKRQSVRKRG